MARAQHRKAHDPCPHGATSWGDCDKAARIAVGQCVAMIDENRQCPHWGVDRVDDRAYCGQHINSVYLAADAARRSAERKAKIDATINAFLAWTAAHPSVHDRMPVGWQP